MLMVDRLKFVLAALLPLKQLHHADALNMFGKVGIHPRNSRANASIAARHRSTKARSGIYHQRRHCQQQNRHHTVQLKHGQGNQHQHQQIA